MHTCTQKGSMLGAALSIFAVIVIALIIASNMFIGRMMKEDERKQQHAVSQKTPVFQAKKVSRDRNMAPARMVAEADEHVVSEPDEKTPNQGINRDEKIIYEPSIKDVILIQ